jgi:hypothetical protein
VWNNKFLRKGLRRVRQLKYFALPSEGVDLQPRPLHLCGAVSLEVSEVLDTMKKEEEWLDGLKTGLLSGSAARKRRATSPQPPAEVASVPLLMLGDLTVVPPSKGPLARAPVEPSRGWLSRMLEDLTLNSGPLSTSQLPPFISFQPSPSFAPQPPVDRIAMLLQTQAFIIASV